MSFKRRMVRSGNAIGVWMHHAAKGRLDGPRGSQILMITTPGRRTGRPRSTMVRYLDHDDGYLVWGTGSGSPTEPDWFRNLRHATSAQVEIGTASRQVRPEVLTGPQRDRMWRDVIVQAVPDVVKYERKSGRIIPVAALHRLPGDRPPAN